MARCDCHRPGIRPLLENHRGPTAVQADHRCPHRQGLGDTEPCFLVQGRMDERSSRGDSLQEDVSAEPAVKADPVAHTPPARCPLEAPPLRTVAAYAKHAVRVPDVPHGPDGENGRLPGNESSHQVDVLVARTGGPDLLKIDYRCIGEDDDVTAALEPAGSGLVLCECDAGLLLRSTSWSDPAHGPADHQSTKVPTQAPHPQFGDQPPRSLHPPADRAPDQWLVHDGCGSSCPVAREGHMVNHVEVDVPV